MSPAGDFRFLLRRAQYIKHPSTVPIPREQKKYCVYFSRVHYARNERTNARAAGHASERTHATAVTLVTPAPRHARARIRNASNTCCARATTSERAAPRSHRCDNNSCPAHAGGRDSRGVPLARPRPRGAKSLASADAHVRNDCSWGVWVYLFISTFCHALTFAGTTRLASALSPTSWRLRGALLPTHASTGTQIEVAYSSAPWVGTVGVSTTNTSSRSLATPTLAAQISLKMPEPPTPLPGPSGWGFFVVHLHQYVHGTRLSRSAPGRQRNR